MKKLIPILSMLMLSVLSGKGQTTFGVKGGLNVAYMNIDMRESHIAYHAGIFVNEDLSDKFFLQPELLYSIKGAKFPEYFFPADMDFTFYYVSMPILFGWKPADHLSLLVGPEISYLTDYKFVINEQPIAGSDGFAEWDVSLDLGVAYAITKKLSVELRFVYGLTNVVNILFTDENGQTIGNLNEGKNRALQLSGCYRFSSDNE